MIPSFFIAHGAPLLAIETNEYTDALRDLPAGYPTPKAIAVFSAHWESPVQQASRVDEFETIYDFGGFPRELYEMTYPARGDHAVTDEITALLATEGIPYRVNEQRGLDHGAWVILVKMFPNPSIPVISLSVNPALEPAEQYRIGKAMSVLREQGVMIIGSGGTVHNLSRVRMGGGSHVQDSWAVEFDDWLKGALERWDLDALYAYDEVGPHAREAVPPYGREHFVPLFYAMGAADSGRSAKLVHRSYQYGSLSHSIWEFA